MFDVVTKISHLIEKQFPAVYREDGENFIAFVKAYYEWLEQSDQAVGKSRTLLDTRDIDATGDEFLDHFRKKYFVGLPKKISGNERFLQKHILDLYRSKGSEEGTKLLFRLLYNEDINIYIPSKDILKPSDGVWVQPQYFEVSNNPNNYLYQGQLVTGSTSGSTAYIDNYKRVFIDERIIHVFYVTNVQGTFEVGEHLVCNAVDITNAAYILGSPIELEVNFATPEQPVGDQFISDTTVGKNQIFGIVAESYDVTDGFINFVVKSGGTKYSAFANISVTTGSNTMGTLAGFTGFTLSNTENFTYNTNIINHINFDKTVYINPYYHVKSSNDFIEVANNQYSNGELIKYICSPGNTVIAGLANTTYYYVVEANTIGFKLSTSYSFKNIDANADVNSTSYFVSVASNPYSNGTPLRYVVAAGNTELDNLANNLYYYAIQANSSGFKLANTYTPLVSFNPKLSVNTEIDDYMFLIKNNTIVDDTIVRYVTAQGNTAVATLANNSYYYVVEANTMGIKLSTTLGGSAISLYSPTLPSEDGHYFYGPGTPIVLTKGNTETGHAFYGGDSAINITRGLDEFGHAIAGLGFQFDANAGIDSLNGVFYYEQHPLKDGDRVTYFVAPGNTALTGLSNNTTYWVVSSNDITFGLASSYNGTPIALTSGQTESGHYLRGETLIDTNLSIDSYGADLLNANIDTIIADALTDNVMTVGTITRLTGVNPGRNYDGDVVVRVRDNYIASYGLYDDNNRIEGNNAILTGKAIRGNDIPQKLTVKDSGFGYNLQGEQILVSNFLNSDKTVDANIVLGAIGTANGYWLNDKGKLSDFPKIHDNFYYQEYSYEIQSIRTLDKYLEVLKQVVHPVGNIPFGKPVLVYKNTVPITIIDSSITQS